ncbi:hypothetical protein N0V95_002025 [Ascochyta clinopodiicola]|nr:hypothetical protein N0V95_002025 [Ascochyta clinopodiicola]
MQQPQMEREGAGSPGPGTLYASQQMSKAVRFCNTCSVTDVVIESCLQDLRTNRPARPTGSRPPPAHFKTWATRESARVPTIASLQAAKKDIEVRIETQAQTASTPQLHRRGASTVSLEQAAGKALVQPPRAQSGDVAEAMQELDLSAEEKLYESARDEAAEIVWKHRNPNAPENNPNAPYAYPGPGRKNLQRPKLQRTRSRSVGPKEDEEQDLQRANSKMRKRHSLGSESGSRCGSLPDEALTGSDNLPDDAITSSDPSPTVEAPPSASPTISSFDLKIAKASSDLPQQRKGSGSRRKASGSLFQNPNDQIYEEPEEEAPPAPAPTPMAAEPPKPAPLPLGMRRNPFTRFQSIKGNPMVRSNTDPIASMKRFDRYEIHRNEPTQSRNAAYTLNTNKSKLAEVTKADAENESEVKMKDGKEIRSDELRAATGFSLKDRSPKLPTPTMVSDRPGRPIVSFQKDYGVIELKEEKSILPADPTPQPLRPAAAPRQQEKAATEPILPTRKSVFERPGSRSGPGSSPFDRPTSRSGAAPSPFERPASRSGTASPAPLKEFGRSSSPAPLGSRPGTPKGPFANKSPLGRLNTASTAPPATSGIPPVPADPYALPESSTTPTTPVTAPPSSRPQPPIPSISVNEPAPTGRGRFSRPQSISNIPTISVSETPSTRHGRAGSIPSIGVTPPVPTISVSASPVLGTAPARGRFNRVSTTQAVPTISVNEPPSMTRGHSFNAPAINLPSDIPTISVNATPTINAPSIAVTPSVPAINVSDSPSTRPLPDPRNYSKKSGAPPVSASQPSRPLPNNARTHWTPTSVRTGAQCTQCALPIAGRIVSAAGCRFHPECFACYQCGEKLECVAFYPEPSAKHAARVDRIRARASGHPIDSIPGWDMRDLESQDGTDESPRFYCHLDFHECFSPRCKSCKTPIEGEVVVACGAEWHPGHFFCAQCGDPFDSNTPFVEKEGFACGPFDDGRYFLRGESQDPVCVRCEERRLKA